MLFCVLPATAIAQSAAADEIVANQNRVPAGKLENGILTVQLELRSGTWHLAADDGPQLFVQAFGEVGRLPSLCKPTYAED